jgi:hypothetical protein
MERKVKIARCIGLILILLLVSLTGNIWAKVLESAYPTPEVIDQIIQDKGNIVTTVDNWGYIGGYSYPYGLPSGEWPKNSGHNYIGEMKFWMGCVTPLGDTIVANSADDFTPIPSLVSGTETYAIRLSTDPTTYDYDVTDTIGYGLSNPAYGWRIYDPDSSAWVYNEIYSPGDSAFHKGGPTGLQQSFLRFQDGNGPTTLGLEVSQTICQWNYCYNEDILFVILEITNVSGVDYNDFAFALYTDIDVGGPDGTGENGRLGDLVAFDSTENLAWTYDADGYDPGWGASVTTGIMGTKYLESPGGGGMTSFRTGQWEDVADVEDPARFALINSTQFDTSLSPRDQYYLQCTRGINLLSDSTVRVVFAIVAGADTDDFYANAATAQTLYDNYFVGPQPPATPTLTVRAGNKKVYLSWNDTAEVDIDPLSGTQDFKGYKLYKSTDRGYTWGKENTKNTNTCLDVDYYPIAYYQTESVGDLIQHSYIDTNLTNGMEYWYCLVSFDGGDTSVPIGSLQNGFGTPGSDINTVKVFPRSDPAGHYDAIETVQHINTAGDKISDGTVYPIVFDESEIVAGNYEIIFTETDEATYWHLINIDEASGDTTWVLKDQTITTGDPELYEIGGGIRAVVRNGDRIPRSMVQTAFATAGDTTLHFGYFYGTMGETFGYPLGSDKHFRSTYELRFTASGSEGYWFWDDQTPMNLPFEVWNTTLGYQVIAEIYDQGFDQVWNPDQKDYIVIVDVPYDGNPHPEVFPYDHTWFFRLDTTDLNYAVGDVFTVEGAPVNGADDVFSFKADGVYAAAAKAELKNIRVVPDPYLGRAYWEQEKFSQKIQFTNLPDECTIRIYTLSGDLVNTLENHDSDGTVDWDMLSKDHLGIASGVYLYHVSSKYGDRVGRFAVIK